MGDEQDLFRNGLGRNWLSSAEYEQARPASTAAFLTLVGKLFAAPIFDSTFLLRKWKEVSRHVRCSFQVVISIDRTRGNQTLAEEIIMKSFLLFIALLCAVVLSTSSAPSATHAANAAKKERAVMTFNQPVKLMGLTLKGEYLFVHDDLAMARGEACTFVYKGNAEIPGKLVVSFHCTPVERAKVANFTVRTLLNSAGEHELREFQFAGSTETHLVPVPLS